MKRPLVASALIIIGVLAIGGVALARTLQYRSHPVVEFEIPTPTVVGTPAEADVKLKLNGDRDELHYDLKITEPIQNVTQSHLHLGAAGTTGGIVAWMYPSAPPLQLIPGETEGRLASGVITPDDLVGPLAGQWDRFLAELEAGNIYANVHTSANPPGEIRDQVHVHGGGHD